MRRLYSAFPSGVPGIGLLLLRGMLGLHLIRSAWVGAIDAHGPGSIESILCVMLLAAGGAFVLGLLTPAVGALSAIAGIAIHHWHPVLGTFPLVPTLATPDFIVIGAALALLGPGAFSLDAHFFGRRKIIIP